MRKILTFPEAHELLLPHYDTIAECIEQSFKEHLELSNEATKFGRPIQYSNRTRANIIHDHLRSLVNLKFSDSDLFQVAEWRKIFGLHISSQAFIRFNKIDSNKMVSSRKTSQHKEYMRQGEIPGLPDEPTLLFAGYYPDQTWTSIQGIYLVCTTNENLVDWSYELDRKTGTEQLSVFERNQGRTNRVRLKNQEIYEQFKIKKSGTDDSV